MESFELFSGIINSLGFPIAMVIYFIWDKNKSSKESTTAINEALGKVTESLNNNTSVLDKILEHFRMGEEN